VVDEVLYLTDGDICALDARDGTERWRVPFGGGAEDSVSVVDGVVYATGEWNTLYALNAEDGTERWRFTAEDEIRTTPAVDGGLAYIVDAYGYLYALNAADGTDRWRFSAGEIGVSGISPAVSEGKIYVCGGAYLFALNAEDGTELWRYASPEGDRFESPAVVGDVVYCGSWETLYAFNAADGTELWRFAVDDSIEDLVIADGVVYAWEGDTLYAIGARVPGGTARVTETASLRGGPAPTAVARAALEPDTVVTITGESEAVGEGVWWPVTVAETGDQGWVEASKLEPISSGAAAG
jgi:outer membrane protein assembly factor BamB